MNKYPIRGTERNPAILRDLANQVRCSSLRMVHSARYGHPAGDLSSSDILVTLYFGVLRIASATDGQRDRFVMSKGHCSGAFYTTLALAGFFPVEELATYMKPLSRLNGHPNRTELPGVESNTGPLGHGLPVATGAALAAKIKGEPWRSFVLTGDGELQEGSNWEALMTAAHYQLDNLTVIIDRNRIQQGDFTEKIVRLEPLADKLRAFGLAVREVDGHDHQALLDTFDALPFEAGKPSCVLARTVKGKGVSFIENKPEWHHHAPTDAELAGALLELQGGAA